MSKVVTSPVGETIEIVNDEEWCELTGCTPKALRFWNMGTKRFALTELFLRGKCEDFKSGRAARVLWERMKETFGDEITTDPISFAGLATDPMNAPAFRRKTNGKRTQMI